MFVAIDRTSKFAYVELHENATTAVSREFLLRLIAAVPYKIHTVLTDNGIQVGRRCMEVAERLGDNRSMAYGQSSFFQISSVWRRYRFKPSRSLGIAA